MATVILFPAPTLADRIDILRDFIDEAETESHHQLNPDEKEELEALINHVWPGIVSLVPSWVTKLVFAFAGFAIGVGIHP